MKFIFFVILASFISFSVSSQEIADRNLLVKDLDFDNVVDTVYIDLEKSIIVCRLSSQQFKKTESLPIEILNDNSGINSTKNGFEFFNNWMRAGYRNQFRYNKKANKIQLIGMSRYEFGNAANDGSGESSVNLLTNKYIGNWSYYDYFANNEEGELIKIPTIKTKLFIKTTYLESFSDSTYFEFADRCSELYHKYKNITIKKRN